jgi:beta-aspartyl-dipeptidase (metallo-type)
MLSGKKGVVYFHMGSGAGKLDPLWEVVDKTEVPISQLLPCHMNRDEALLAEGVNWVSAPVLCPPPCTRGVRLG